jgi:predicted ATPase
LTKHVMETVESPLHAPSPLAIPATLQDSLMARLDRMAIAKEVAQLGATIGREFSYELLHAVSALDEASLQQALAKLVEAELLYQRGTPPQARYLFKHALIQDAAYQALLKSTRQQYHSQIVRVLEGQFPEIKDTQPELLAQHYTEAGRPEQAIPYWQQAGQRAIERSANLEAISHLTQGLEMVKVLPDTAERVQHELTLQLTLSSALSVAKGYTAPEVERVCIRARELCQQLGETPQLFPMLFRLFVFYINRGELQTALELAEQQMRLAQQVQARDLLSAAHQALGVTLNHRGELIAARTHIEQTLALYDPQTPLRTAIGTADLRVNSLSHAALNLWYLGYPEQSRQRSQEAVALAEELAHSYSLVYTLFWAAWLCLLLREEQKARERAEAVITLSTEQGFAVGLALGTILRGRALAKQGQVEEGLAQMHQGLAAYRAMGAKLTEPYVLAELAEAYGKVGQEEKGLSVLVEALAMADSTGERIYEAELYRQKGTLVLRSGVRSPASGNPNTQHLIPSSPAQAEAEACFLKAIEIARGQQAKSWELRAVMSLSRLWQSQGKQAEARQLLAEIHGWFTEGFATKDLQEARALLEELA